MRTRRDHARFLNLIEVSAFLHQFHRERQNGAVVASADDYKVAYELSREVLSETLSDVKKPLRQAYERIQTVYVKQGGPISRRDIREALNVPDSTVRRWLSELVEYEYLVPIQPERARQGRAMRYRLPEREPKVSELKGLLNPEELRSVLGNFATSPRGATGRVAGLRR